MTDEAALKGARVLVVEDEMMAASMIEIVLGDAGCVVVGPAATIEDAMALADSPLDVAILDVNLGGEPVFPLADRLAARQVPLIFVTGYGVTGINGGRYEGVPVVQKPYDDIDLVDAVAKQLAGRRPVS